MKTAISIRPAAHPGHGWRNDDFPTIATISLGYNPKHRRAERDANAALITAAPDYAAACGLDLHPGERESCGPLAWFQSAIDTLKEDAVREAAEGDDTDAYWTMVGECEYLLARLKAATAKAEQRKEESHG